MSKDYSIVYSDDVIICKDEIVHLILDANSTTSIFPSYEMQGYCYFYNLLDKNVQEKYKKEKFTVDMLADRLMKFYINNHVKEKLCFTVFYIYDNDYSGFEEKLNNGHIFDSYLDYHMVVKNQCYSYAFELPMFKLPNILGFYCDGQVLHILNKKSLMNIIVKEAAPLYCMLYQKESLFDYLLDYKRIEKKEILYSIVDDYWFILFERYRFLLNKSEEPEPFIPITNNQIKKLKSDALETHIWLKDNIISKIPYSDVSVKSNVKVREIKKGLDSDSLEIISNYEHNFRNNTWKEIETENYIAYYCTDRLYTYKVISKQTHKIVCLSYYK